MYWNQIYTLIASIQVTAPVMKALPIYARNPGQLDANFIIEYGISVGSHS